MDGPRYHHLARGIHPAAYFQPTRPTGINDGDCWIDSSSGPPYALRVWNAGTATWQDVGGTGASIPAGSGGDIVVNISGTWDGLVPTKPGDVLVLGGTPSAPIPQWGPDCCSKDAPPPLSGVTTTPPLDERPWGYVAGSAGSLQGGAHLQTPDEAQNERYCAAAIAMSDYLIINYDLVAKILNSSFAADVGMLTYRVFFGIAKQLEKVFSPPAGTVQMPFWTALLNAIWQYIDGGWTAAGPFPNVISMILRLFPILNDVQKQYIQCACYCALVANEGQVDATFVTVWRDYMGLAGSDIFDLPGLKAFVCALEDYVPLVYWQALAAVGSLGHSFECLSCVCGLFPPIRGGASVQGGVRLRLVGPQSLLGGAQYMPGGTGGSVRGGAAYSGTGGTSLTGGVALA